MIELYCVIKTEFQDKREKVKEYFSFGNRNHIKEIYYNGIKNSYDFIIIDDFKFQNFNDFNSMVEKLKKKRNYYSPFNI
jgi:hypothetical protein